MLRMTWVVLGGTGDDIGVLGVTWGVLWVT